MLDAAMTSTCEPAAIGVHRRLDEAQRQLRASDWQSAQITLDAALGLLRSIQADRHGGASCSGLTASQQRKLTTFIEQRLSGPISLTQLAEVVKLSPSHFCRTFGQSYGTSPLRYVLMRRVERAKTLLLGAEMPLAEIALECAFSDQSALCRAFRRQTGESPAVWRRRRLDQVRSTPSLGNGGAEEMPANGCVAQRDGGARVGRTSQTVEGEWECERLM